MKGSMSPRLRRGASPPFSVPRRDSRAQRSSDATPLVFGVLPIGLFYHAAYTVAVSLVLLLIMPLVWPSHLEPADERGRP